MCAAFSLAEIAVLDGLEHLGLGAQDNIFRLCDVAVDHGREGRVFLPLETAGTFELGLAIHDPGVGRLLAVEGLGLAMDDHPSCLDDDLGGKGLGAVFASPSNYRTHRLSHLLFRCQSA